jgi:hypothetical protein
LPDAKDLLNRAAEERRKNDAKILRRQKLLASKVVQPTSDDDMLVIVDGPDNVGGGGGRSTPPLPLTSPSRPHTSEADRRLRALTGRKHAPSLKRTDSEVRRAGQATTFTAKAGNKDNAVRHEDLNKTLLERAAQKGRESRRKKEEQWAAKNSRRPDAPVGGETVGGQTTQGGRNDGEVSGMFEKKLEEAKARKEKGEKSEDEEEEADDDFNPDEAYDLGSGSEAAAEDEDEGEKEGDDDEEEEEATGFLDEPRPGQQVLQVNAGGNDSPDEDEESDAPLPQSKRRRLAVLVDDEEEEERGNAPVSASNGGDGGGGLGFSQFFNDEFSQAVGERFMVCLGVSFSASNGSQHTNEDFYIFGSNRTLSAMMTRSIFSPPLIFCQRAESRSGRSMKTWRCSRNFLSLTSNIHRRKSKP